MVFRVLSALQSSGRAEEDTVPPASSQQPPHGTGLATHWAGDQPCQPDCPPQSAHHNREVHRPGQRAPHNTSLLTKGACTSGPHRMLPT